VKRQVNVLLSTEAAEKLRNNAAASGLSRLLAVEALPRGERLARWCEAVDAWRKWLMGPSRTWIALATRAGLPRGAAGIRARARPLRLARERLREARAAPPTRAEVEAAVDDLVHAVLAGYGSAAGRAALVALATRGTHEGIPGTRPQPAPTTDARSRDVLPHAVEMVEHWDSENTAYNCAIDALTLMGMSTTDIASAIKARAAAGVAKYGVPLQTHNGRDAREDARQELLDALMYLAQAEMEAGE
jgi:hypothetical protein